MQAGRVLAQSWSRLSYAPDFVSGQVQIWFAGTAERGLGPRSVTLHWAPAELWKLAPGPFDSSVGLRDACKKQSAKSLRAPAVLGESMQRLMLRVVAHTYWLSQHCSTKTYSALRISV